MRQVLIGLIGGVLGIGAIAWLTQLTNVPLLIAPFGATCVLLFAAPTAPLAQPRNVVIGGCKIFCVTDFLINSSELCPRTLY
ncbi:HPP family protein [Oligella sp. MSHR50489EDL]|uniref:HPP family protein n=1 Tax=Oligella sp. MSHR50489EDL TaxID=3139409 RepID=UPI003D81ABD0